MSINFLHIFQESYYFVRNRYPIVVTFTVLISLNALIYQLWLQSSGLLELNTSIESSIDSIPTDIIAIALISSMVAIFIDVWFILTIDQVSTNRITDVIACLPMAFKKFPAFFGYLCLCVFSLVPAILGISMSLLPEGGIMSAIVCVLFLLISLFLLTKLILLPYACVLEPDKQGLTTLYKWVNRHKNYMVIMIYLFLVYIVPAIINKILSVFLGGHFIILAVLIASFLSLFFTIFAYRFYRIFIKSLPL